MFSFCLAVPEVLEHGFAYGFLAKGTDEVFLGRGRGETLGQVVIEVWEFEFVDFFDQAVGGFAGQFEEAGFLVDKVDVFAVDDFEGIFVDGIMGGGSGQFVEFFL